MATKPEPGAGTRPASTSSTSSDSKQRMQDLRQRKGQFLIAPRRHPGMQMMGIAPLSMATVEQALKDSPDIEIIDRVGARQIVGALAAGM